MLFAYPLGSCQPSFLSQTENSLSTYYASIVLSPTVSKQRLFSVYNPSPQAMHFQLYSDNFLEWKHKVCESVRLREWFVLVLLIFKVWPFAILNCI